MTTTTTLNYLTEDEFRQTITSNTTVKADHINASILTASRMIDAECGRYFYQQDATKYLSPEPGNLYILSLGDDDLATTTGLIVTVEFGTDGTYPETRTINTDFICDPINQYVHGIQGWPYTSLRAINGKIWPTRWQEYYRPTVKVVGTFGWPAVPAPIKAATKIVTNALVKLPEAPFGVAGVNGWGDLRVRDPLAAGIAEGMIRPYRRSSMKFLVG